MTLTHPEPELQGNLSFSVVNSTEIALNIPQKRIFYESVDYRQDNSLC